MADFKDVIIRLQENKNDNREVIKEQTVQLSSAFKDVIKSQNRSFGQSLSLQQGKTNEALQGLASLFKVEGKGENKIESAQLGSLDNVATILTDIHESLERTFKLNEQMALEQERLRLLNQNSAAPGVAGAAGGETSKGKGLGMLGIGALAGAALAGAKGLAMMGVAISAFFGGLVAGNAALDYLDADLDFTKIKEAAKGFSGIVGELTPEAMVALGGLMAVSAVGGTKAAKGVGTMGFAISAFFVGLLAGDALIEGYSALGGDTDFEGMKKVVVGFNGLIAEMSTSTQVALGTLIAAGSVLGIAGKSAMLKAALGVAAMGASIVGLFIGFAAGDALIEGTSLADATGLEGIKKVITSLGEIIGDLDATTITALGVLIGGGIALGVLAKNPLTAGLAVASLGAGIAGLFIGLAVADATMAWLGSDFNSIATAMTGFSSAIGNLDDKALVALTGLLAAGGLLGAITTPAAQAKMVLGIGALSLGVAAFFMGFATADFIAANVGDGSSAKTLITNFGEAISALDTTALSTLGVLLGAGAIFGMVPGAAGGAAIGMGLIGAGIAAFFLAFDGMTKVASVIGVDGSGTKALIGNMAEGVAKLNEIDGQNLDKIVGPLALLGPAILAFMGSKGLGGLVTGTVGAAKDGFNYLKSFFSEPGPKGPTLIDSMVEMLKPLEDFNADSLSGFITSTNALTDFINNDYRKGADDFEYFVNKLVETVPKLESAVFGNGDDLLGLANGDLSYLDAARNVTRLKEALSLDMGELSQTQMDGTAGSGGVVNASANSISTQNVTSKSTYSVQTSSTNHEKTIGMMNHINGSLYNEALPDF